MFAPPFPPFPAASHIGFVEHLILFIIEIISKSSIKRWPHVSL